MVDKEEEEMLKCEEKEDIVANDEEMLEDEPLPVSTIHELKLSGSSRRPG